MKLYSTFIFKKKSFKFKLTKYLPFGLIVDDCSPRQLDSKERYFIKASSRSTDNLTSGVQRGN